MNKQITPAVTNFHPWSNQRDRFLTPSLKYSLLLVQLFLSFHPPKTTLTALFWNLCSDCRDYFKYPMWCFQIMQAYVLYGKFITLQFLIPCQQKIFSFMTKCTHVLGVQGVFLDSFTSSWGLLTEPSFVAGVTVI